jgi:hypothetical protein
VTTDAGQMHLYLNYARQHWSKPGENPPVGLIICATKGVAEAHYALEGLWGSFCRLRRQTALCLTDLIRSGIRRGQESCLPKSTHLTVG